MIQSSISVVIVNFNGPDITPVCLESIPSGIETVVIDNGSKDGSADEIAARFPGATLIRNPVNRGFAAAVNQGIAASRGRFICLLNSDARLSADALQKLVAYLEGHPDVGVVAPQLLHEDGRKQNSFDNCPSFASVILNKSLLRMLFPGRYPSKRQETTEPRDVESVIGACMMLRRDLVPIIGGLDESYFLFLEETDWCLRARQAGSRVVFVPSASVVHLQGRSRDKVRFRAKVEYTRSLFTFLRKHRPVGNFWVRVLHPIKSLLEFVFGLFGLFTAKGRRRWAENGAVLGWQLCGCPRSFGLSMASEPKYLTLRDGTRVLEEHMDAFNEFENKSRQQKVIKDHRHKKTVEYASGGKTYLVKMYKVDSFGRRIAAALAGSKARREFEVSRDLQRRGLPAVRVVAMKDSGDLRWIACEKLDGWEQLQAVLLSESTPSARRRRLCFLYGVFARRLQDAGVRQYDFNPSNVLVRDTEMLLIDFERVSIRGRALPESDRMYLLAKMNRLPGVSRTDRWRFLKGYLAAHVVESKQPRLAADEILRRGTLQAKVDAERTEDRCVFDNRDFGPFEIGEVAGYYLKDRPDRASVGLKAEDLRALAEANAQNGAYREEAVEDAIEEWKRANRRARDGGAAPVAVLMKRGERRGRIVYRV